MNLMGLRRAGFVLTLLCLLLMLSACLARRRAITRGKASPTQTLLTADKATLLNEVAELYQTLQTLNLTVDMVPALGSVNKGKITEYKDVRAYILFKKPSDIRIIGLYPVVRNTAFDMVSTGAEFRLFLPSKNQFIVGRNELAAPSPNKLENLRPSIFLNARLIAPSGSRESAVIENLTDEDNAVYVIHIIDGTDGQLRLIRDIWFSRLSLHIVRQILFDEKGDILTDTRYSDWKNYDNVPFPRVIDINRPQDDYGVVITVVKADINKAISNDKFTLQQPEGSQLRVLGNKPPEQQTVQPAGDSSASRKKNQTD